MINVLFFGKLRESLHCAQLTLPVEHFSSVDELKKILFVENPAWQVLLDDENIQIAVNQAIVTANKTVSSGDEVAFFPPVTGG